MGGMNRSGVPALSDWTKEWFCERKSPAAGNKKPGTKAGFLHLINGDLY